MIKNETESSGMFCQYFCSLFGREQGDVRVSHADDETLSKPLAAEAVSIFQVVIFQYLCFVIVWCWGGARRAAERWCLEGAKG